MNLLDSIATDMVAKKINAVILTETKPLNLPLQEDKKNPPERDWRNKLNQKKKEMLRKYNIMLVTTPDQAGPGYVSILLDASLAQHLSQKNITSRVDTRWLQLTLQLPASKFYLIGVYGDTDPKTTTQTRELLVQQFRALHDSDPEAHYAVAGDINEVYLREDTSSPTRSLDKDGFLEEMHTSLIDSLMFHESTSKSPRHSYSSTHSSGLTISSRLDYIFLSPSLISPTSSSSSLCQGTIDRCHSYISLNATLDHLPVLAQCQHPALPPPKPSPDATPHPLDILDYTSLSPETWERYKDNLVQREATSLHLLAQLTKLQTEMGTAQPSAKTREQAFSLVAEVHEQITRLCRESAETTLIPTKRHTLPRSTKTMETDRTAT